MRDSFTTLNAFSSLVLSLALALIIWIAAASNSLERVLNYPLPQERGIPIELRSVPEGLIVTEGEEQRVLVDLLINSEWRNELAPDDLVAYVDLAELGPGRHQVEVVVERQPLAPPFRIVEENPNRVTINLDEEITREFGVDVVISDPGTIASNYQVLTPTVSPPIVAVTGPRELVEPIEEVVGEVEVDGARETVVREVTPRLLTVEGDAVDLDELRLSASPLTVTVPIEQKPGYRELIVRTVITGTSALAERGYWISGQETNPLLVAVVGQPRVVEELNGIVETQPVDVSNLEEGVIIREVPLQLPEGISPVNQDFVTVTVRVEPQTSSKTVTLTPEVAGLAPGLTVTDTAIVPSTIDVLLRGPIRELEELNLDDISATLDLAGMEVGSYLVEPRINAPGNLRAESVIPEQVEVTITEEQASEEFQVPLRARGVPADSFAAIEPRFVTVTIAGPALELANFDPSQVQATVDVVEGAGEIQVLTPTVTVREPFQVTGVSAEQATVQLFQEDALLPVTEPIEIVGLAATEAVTVIPSEVVVWTVGPGTEEALSLHPDLGVTVDASGLAAGVHSLYPQVRLPTGYELVTVEPDRVQLRLPEG